MSDIENGRHELYSPYQSSMDSRLERRRGEDANLSKRREMVVGEREGMC